MGNWYDLAGEEGWIDGCQGVGVNYNYKKGVNSVGNILLGKNSKNDETNEPKNDERLTSWLWDITGDFRHHLIEKKNLCWRKRKKQPTNYTFFENDER